jgi:sulfhydrogenase subunit beta (sulfur reductase)
MCSQDQEVLMKILAKKNVPDVLRSWSKDFKVLSPTKQEQGDCIFDIFSEEKFTLEYNKPPMPPKSSFLPQSEVIFTVDHGDFTPVVSEGRTLLFGIRACDLMGILQSKSFYGRDRDDVYFRAHSKNTVVVVLACNQSQNETCFCTTMRSGPYAEKGFDVQLFDMGDDFFVEEGSEIGKELTSSETFTEIGQTDVFEQLTRIKNTALNSIPLVPFIADAMDILKNSKGSDNVWEALGRKCISCGGCVHVCPTCTCYNVADRTCTPESGERIRTWDTCLYGGFTREASGHNPRSSQGLRLKRRHEHKLLYFNETDIQGALSGCVGCGRCSDYCPVHIGTLEVVKSIVDQPL